MKPGGGSRRSTSGWPPNVRAWFWTPWLALALTGCAGYQLGPTHGQRAGVRSVQVNPLANQTLEPRLGESVTHSLRKHLQQDGTFRLNTHNEGDIIVTGAIVEYDRHAISFQPADVVTPVDYQLTLRAQIVARDRLTGKVILDRKVTGQTVVRIGPGTGSTNWQALAERQALPLLADDLARRATALLVDGEW